jgi:histidinol-phosphatase (PHP family)
LRDLEKTYEYFALTIHLERGEYTKDWLDRFVETAISRNISEIWLLEHCYRFCEFVPMYDGVCACSEYIDKWFHRKAGVMSLDDYLRFIESMRKIDFPIQVKFGLEVCYFKEYEDLVYSLTKDTELDFLVGSMHFIDNFAFDHKPEHWQGVDVDKAYKRYFEMTVDLVKCGIYSGLAHPDSIKLFGHKPSYPLDDAYEAVAAALAGSNMYAEQSSGCHRRCPETAALGMEPGFINALKRHNVPLITASDAHSPEDVGLWIPELEGLIKIA